MTSEERARVREVEWLRVAAQQAEALCATLDKCEFYEPLAYEAEIDAKRCERALIERLRVAEGALYRDHCNLHGNGVKSFTA